MAERLEALGDTVPPGDAVAPTVDEAVAVRVALTTVVVAVATPAAVGDAFVPTVDVAVATPNVLVVVAVADAATPTVKVVVARRVAVGVAVLLLLAAADCNSGRVDAVGVSLRAVVGCGAASVGRGAPPTRRLNVRAKWVQAATTPSMGQEIRRKWNNVTASFRAYQPDLNRGVKASVSIARPTFPGREAWPLVFANPPKAGMLSSEGALCDNGETKCNARRTF
jgi:hypothetical protein